MPMRRKAGMVGLVRMTQNRILRPLNSGGKLTGCYGMHLIILFLLKLMHSSLGFTMMGVVGRTSQV
uniref:Uncharacterized protein n=1 Tax=Arundo donax TaxID=35708 RepID=A0A0A8Z0X2_ARUDO